MKKLSELKNSDMVSVYYEEYFEPFVMSKEDFLESEYFEERKNNKIKLFMVQKEVVKFDLFDVLEEESENMYEDWYVHILEDLQSIGPEIEEFTNKVNEILNGRPSYYNGEEIEIDY